MSGKKTFIDGVTLPAVDINGYLMNQTVIRCTSGARPAADGIGMVIEETDTGRFYYWNGTTYLPISGMYSVTGGGWTAGGTYSDIAGTSMTLPAGNWALTAMVNLAVSTASAVQYSATIYNTTAGTGVIGSSTVIPAGSFPGQIILLGSVALTTPSALKLQALTTSVTGTQTIPGATLTAIPQSALN